MKTILSFLAKIKIARGQTYLNLTVFPLMAPGDDGPDYLTLDTALGLSLFGIVREHSEQAAPDIRLVNYGRKGILVVRGEELEGAGRIGESFLVPGETTVVIPPHLVEPDRWNAILRGFKPGAHGVQTLLRILARRETGTGLVREEDHHLEQGRIWDHIYGEAGPIRTASAQGATADLFGRQGSIPDDFRQAFRLVECQVGAVFVISGRIVGLEAFGCHQTMSDLFGKLVRDHTWEALRRRTENPPAKIRPDIIRRFITSLSKSRGRTRTSPGRGAIHRV